MAFRRDGEGGAGGGRIGSSFRAGEEMLLEMLTKGVFAVKCAFIAHQRYVEQ